MHEPRLSLARTLPAVRALSRYRSVVALCTIVCLTSAPNVVLLGDAPQGYRQKTRGRRGIRGNSAKKNKSKTTRIFRRARLFLEHAATSWSNELQSLASSPGHLDREFCFSRIDASLILQAATQPPHGAASLTRTLYVRQAAPVSITSQPMPRAMIAASSRGSGKRCRGPEPSTTISGCSANTASRSASRQLVERLRPPVLDQPLRADQAASLQHRVADAHLAGRVRAHQQRAASSVVRQSHCLTIARMTKALTLIAPEDRAGIASGDRRARRALAAPRAARRSRRRFAHCRRRATDCARGRSHCSMLLGVTITRSIRVPPSRAPATSREPARGFWLHLQPMHFMAGLDRLTAVVLHGASRRRARGAGGAGADDRRASAHCRDATGDDVARAIGSCTASARSTCRRRRPRRAAASPLEQAMPQGRDAPALRRLMTELQMLLHEHPVNVARRAARRAGDQCGVVSWSRRNSRPAALRFAAGFRRRSVLARNLSFERRRRDGRSARCAGDCSRGCARARSSSSLRTMSTRSKQRGSRR